jgi:hypothetical protein
MKDATLAVHSTWLVLVVTVRQSFGVSGQDPCGHDREVVTNGAELAY